MNWPKEIAVMALVKGEIAKADRQNLWPYALPRVAAQPPQIAAVESQLGFALEGGYRAFLQHADGWPAFYQTVDLFGTPELLGDEKLLRARRALAHIEDDVLVASGVGAAQLLPIAATAVDLDLFAMVVSASKHTGEVIWFAGTEIERFSSFAKFFRAMADYNRRELASLRGADNSERAN